MDPLDIHRIVELTTPPNVTLDVVDFQFITLSDDVTDDVNVLVAFELKHPDLAEPYVQTFLVSRHTWAQIAVVALHIARDLGYSINADGVEG